MIAVEGPFEHEAPANDDVVIDESDPQYAAIEKRADELMVNPAFILKVANMATDTMLADTLMKATGVDRDWDKLVKGEAFRLAAKQIEDESIS